MRCWLVRVLDGKHNAQVFALRRHQPPKCWKFNHGVAAIGRSLTETLDRAFDLQKRNDKHAR